MIGEKELYIIQLVLHLFLFPVTLIALIFLFTIHYVFSSTLQNIYNQVNGSCEKIIQTFHHITLAPPSVRG